MTLRVNVLIVDLERDESESSVHSVRDLESAHELMRDLTAQYRGHWNEIEVSDDDSVSISIACNGAL